VSGQQSQAQQIDLPGYSDESEDEEYRQEQDNAKSILSAELVLVGTLRKAHQKAVESEMVVASAALDAAGSAEQKLHARLHQACIQFCKSKCFKTARNDKWMGYNRAKAMSTSRTMPSHTEVCLLAHGELVVCKARRKRSVLPHKGVLAATKAALAATKAVSEELGVGIALSRVVRALGLTEELRGLRWPDRAPWPVSDDDDAAEGSAAAAVAAATVAAAVEPSATAEPSATRVVKFTNGLGEAIKKMITDRATTYKRLAEEIGADKSYISHFLCGRSAPAAAIKLVDWFVLHGGDTSLVKFREDGSAGVAADEARNPAAGGGEKERGGPPSALPATKSKAVARDGNVREDGSRPLAAVAIQPSRNAILALVLPLLDSARDLCAASGVCRAWHAAALSNAVWNPRLLADFAVASANNGGCGGDCAAGQANELYVALIRARRRRVRGTPKVIQRVELPTHGRFFHRGRAPAVRPITHHQVWPQLLPGDSSKMFVVCNVSHPGEDVVAATLGLIDLNSVQILPPRTATAVAAADQGKHGLGSKTTAGGGGAHAAVGSPWPKHVWEVGAEAEPALSSPVITCKAWRRPNRCKKGGSTHDGQKQGGGVGAGRGASLPANGMITGHANGQLHCWDLLTGMRFWSGNVGGKGARELDHLACVCVRAHTH
jgi:hypothetical protein